MYVLINTYTLRVLGVTGKREKRAGKMETIPVLKRLRSDLRKSAIRSELRKGDPVAPSTGPTHGQSHSGEACKPGWSATRTGCTPKKPGTGSSEGEGGKVKLPGAVQEKPATEEAPEEPAAPKRIPAEPKEVVKRLKQMQGTLQKKIDKATASGDESTAHGYTLINELMEMVQQHVAEVGVEGALQDLGEEKPSTPESERKVAYEGVWEGEGAFINDYLKMAGITTTQSTGGKPSPELQLISSWTPAQRRNAGTDFGKRAVAAGVPEDFIPPDPTIEDKLTESKHLPGLESSEDIHKLTGKHVERLDNDVLAKLDQTYGKGKWIIKSYGAEAYAGFGIYFPERVRQMQREAKSDMVLASSRLAGHGFKIARNEQGDAIGIKDNEGKEYKFGSSEYNDLGKSEEIAEFSKRGKGFYKEVKKWGTLAQNAARNENGVKLPGAPEEELNSYGYKLSKDAGGKVSGLETTDGSGKTYEFGSKEYKELTAEDESLGFWADRAASTTDYYKETDTTPAKFMAQPAFKAVGVSQQDRAWGATWETAKEGRVHVITRNGKAEAVPYSMFVGRGDELPAVFINKDIRDAMKAAEHAVDSLPESERQGQTYAPDVLKHTKGWGAVETNPEAEGGGSSWLGSNPFAIDAYVSHIVGREPAHVKFIRRLLTGQQTEKKLQRSVEKRVRPVVTKTAKDKERVVWIMTSQLLSDIHARLVQLQEHDSGGKLRVISDMLTEAVNNRDVSGITRYGRQLAGYYKDEFDLVDAQSEVQHYSQQLSAALYSLNGSKALSRLCYKNGQSHSGQACKPGWSATRTGCTPAEDGGSHATTAPAEQSSAGADTPQPTTTEPTAGHTAGQTSDTIDVQSRIDAATHDKPVYGLRELPKQPLSRLRDAIGGKAPSKATQDYIKAIHRLGGVDGKVSPSAIASRLHVSAPSVTGMLKRLARDGLIDYSPGRGGVQLTAQGKSEARKVVRRHRLVESLLTKLGADWSDVHQEAEALEHAISPEVEQLLERFLSQPKEDPHGHPIPTAEGELESRQAQGIDTLKPGESATVREVSDDDPKMLRRFSELGIKPGAKVTLVSHDALDGLYKLEVDGKPVTTTATGLAGILASPDTLAGKALKSLFRGLHTKRQWPRNLRFPRKGDTHAGQACKPGWSASRTGCIPQGVGAGADSIENNQGTQRPDNTAVWNEEPLAMMGDTTTPSSVVSGPLSRLRPSSSTPNPSTGKPSIAVRQAITTVTDRKVSAKLQEHLPQVRKVVDNLQSRASDLVKASIKDVWPDCPKNVSDGVATICGTIDMIGNSAKDIAVMIFAPMLGETVAAGTEGSAALIGATAELSEAVGGAVGEVAAHQATTVSEALSPPACSLSFVAYMTVAAGVMDKKSEGIFTAISRKARERVEYLWSGEGHAR